MLFTHKKRSICLYGLADLLANKDFRDFFPELENINKYLFSMVDFEILDVFVRFNFFSLENYLKLFENLISFRVNMNQTASKACCFIIYYLNNNLLDAENILDAAIGHFVNVGYHPEITREHRDYCENKILKVYSYEIKKMKSLVYWAKQAVRSSIGAITNDKLEKLNLPTELRNLILETYKLEENKFN